MNKPSQWELFHQVADPPSAKVRRFMVDHHLEDRLRIRNVAYPEVAEALAQHGGERAPALWDGESLAQGAEAVLARLQRLVDIGRTP